MPITVADIKLTKSKVMDDVPEGGGPPVAATIEDNVSNDIFPDISELDRAGGRVNVRKTFVAVRTDDREGYFGANVIVAEPPADPNVNVSLFTTRNAFDTRSAAVSRIEAYLNAGPEWAGFLYENHITGQRSVQLLMRVNQAPPPVGRTLLIRQNEGLGTQYEQYVRITRVTVEERTFTYNVDQDYTANVVTCDISDALRFDFTGTPANRAFTRNSNAAIVRDTVVADAATYYAAVPLTQPVAIGDIRCRAESIYTQLVPNSRTETSLVDVRPSQQYLVTLATTPRLVEVGGSPLSQRIRIGQENRGFNYVTILNPLPAPTSLRVVYRALGNTYTIEDNGDGTLGGNGAPGSGTVNYLTGSVSVTLEALPDDRSAVVFYWGQNTSYTNRTGQAGFRAPEYVFDLENQGIERNTFQIQWTSASVLRTATDNGNGKLTGDATGEINYVAGVVFIRPNHMLDPGGEFSISYQWCDLVEETKTGLTPDAAGAVTFSLTQQPVPGTVEVEWLTLRETSTTAGSTSASGSSAKTNDSKVSVAFVDKNRTYRSYTPEVSAAYKMPTEEVSIRVVTGS